jgi:hypothetical protein
VIRTMVDTDAKKEDDEIEDEFPTSDSIEFKVLSSACACICNLGMSKESHSEILSFPHIKLAINKLAGNSPEGFTHPAVERLYANCP